MVTATYEPQPTSALDRPIWSVLALDWEKTLYLTLVVLAFVTRFYDLGARVMSHDESLHTQYAWYLYKNGNYQHDPVMHGPLKFEVTAFVYWMFGDNDFTARIPTAVMGVLAVGLCYFYRKWLGRAGALVAALLMLISPYQLYYARYIRDEAYVVVWGMLLVLMVLHYMESRSPKFLYGLAAVSALFYATMESSFIYIAIVLVFLGAFFMYELIVTRWPRPELRQPFLILVAVGVVAGLIGLGLFFSRDRLGVPLSATQVQAPAQPGQSAAESGAMARPELITDLAFLGALVAGGVALGLVVQAFGREGIRRFPALDLIAVLLLFAIPQLGAFPVRALGRNPINYAFPAMQGLDLGALLLSDAFVTMLVTLALIGLSLALGLLWNAPVFIVCAAIFWGIYIPLFTTFFTNGAGLGTGLVGSLGYWLEQHGVRRGSQPWYYYVVVNIPMYEFLPAIGSLFAAGLGLYHWLRPRPVEEADQENETGEAPPLRFPAIGLIGFWSVMALSAFSVAGEKMPWLTTHISLPLILLSGWSIGWFIDRIDWEHFRKRRAWLVAILLPVTLVALFAVFGSLLGNTPPFQGNELNQITATGQFISALIVAVIGLWGLSRLGEPLGWANVARLAVLSFFGLLALLTARAAFIASYINYDYANEFLVYAHGARGVKTVMEQIEEISERTQDGLGLKVAYDSEVSWPVTWYLRNYRNQAFYGKQPTRDALDAPVVIASGAIWNRVETLLGDRYYRFEYIRMVWPMQDYFPREEPIGVRILNALSNREMRQALWNIWWNRDYTYYGQLTGQNFDLAQWPLADRMRLYVRKDIAAQIWAYGVGPTQLAQPVQEDPYVKSRQLIPAVLTYGSEGSGPGQFQRPRGIAVAPDGSVYVADTFNHRLQKFDSDGTLLLTFGQFGKVEDGSGLAGGSFNEPWGVAVGPDGSVYVADTWNNRVQKFDADGNFLTMWGKGVVAQDGGFDSFYGPRAVAVGPDGRVYVADTGNKRVVVFDQNGNGLVDLGGGGFEPGFLDEPVGLAVTRDNVLYVADTWNQRIQRFRLDAATDEYVFEREFPVVAWPGQSVDNKPYLALDAQGRVYVTEPEGYRVLVFDRNGEFLATWGDAGSDASTFALLSGIAVDSTGHVYVVDTGNHRVMKFPPLP